MSASKFLLRNSVALVTSLLLALSLSFFLIGCGSESGSESGNADTSLDIVDKKDPSTQGEEDESTEPDADGDDESSDESDGANTPSSGSSNNGSNANNGSASGESNAGGGSSSGELTYEEYQAMSADEQKAWIDSFDDVDDFFVWYNDAKAEHDAQSEAIIIEGDETINLGEL